MRPAEAIGAILEEGKRFLLTTHVSPDGDGFGAELAFLRYLRSLGKDVRVLNPEAHTSRLDFLLREEDRVEVFDEAAHGAWAREADALFLLDVNTLGRLGPMAPVVEGAHGKVVCIDHHLPGKDGFDVTYVSEAACATGELICDLMGEIGVEVTAEMAEPLYVCLLTDTGSFRFSKTSPRAHNIAARLLELGVRPQDVYENLYEGLSVSTVLLTGDVLSTLRTDCGGRLAWLVLTREMLLRRGANFDDVSDVINHTISLEGVEVGVLFKELGPGLTKASLRSKGRLNVNAFARRLGGGGHQHAAGIVLEEEFDEGCRRLLEALAEALKELP